MSMMPPQMQQPPMQDEPFLSKVMKDPWFRLGMALLEQSGPQARPHSVGQDISRAFGTVQQGDAAMEERNLRNQQLMQMKQQQAWATQAMQGLSGGDQQQAPPQQPPMPQMMPQQPQGAPQMQPALPPQMGQAIAPGAAPPPQAMPRGGQYEQLIQKAAQAAGVDPRLFASLVHSESRGQHFNPKNPQQLLTSPKGALGLAQLMPPTAKELGVDPADPEQNLMGGARYLSQMQKKFGNDFDALRAYNAGPGNASMSKTISTEYANTILGRLGGPAQQSAPTQAPAPQQRQNFDAQLPPDLKRMFLSQAYAEGGGDPVQTMQAFYKLANAWRMQQMTSGQKTGEQFELERFKAGNDLNNQRSKIDYELQRADDKSQSEALGKAFAEDYTGIRKEASAAGTKIEQFRTLGKLLEGVYTGAGGNSVKDLVKIGAALGIEGLDEQASAADAADSIIKKLTLQGRGPDMPGAMSEGDRMFLEKMPPGFEKTPAGNRFLVEYYVRQERRKMDIAKLARKYRKDNGNFDDGFDDVREEYEAKNPLFKDGEVRTLLGAKINPAHIQMLKSNPSPEMRALFDEQFGAGAAARTLGGK